MTSPKATSKQNNLPMAPLAPHSYLFPNNNPFGTGPWHNVN